MWQACCVRVGQSSLCSVLQKPYPLSCPACVFFCFVFRLKSASVMQHLGVDENQKKCGLSVKMWNNLTYASTHAVYQLNQNDDTVELKFEQSRVGRRVHYIFLLHTIDDLPLTICCWNIACAVKAIDVQKGYSGTKPFKYCKLSQTAWLHSIKRDGLNCTRSRSDFLDASHIWKEPQSNRERRRCERRKFWAN